MTRVVKPSAWINRQVGRRGKVIARAAALLVAGGVAVVLLRSDVIASLTAVAATVAGVMAARWRRPTVFRGVAAGLVVCIAAGAGGGGQCGAQAPRAPHPPFPARATKSPYRREPVTRCGR